jgi:hypothetical protein
LYKKNMPWSMKLYNIRNINFLISLIQCFSYNSPPRIPYIWQSWNIANHSNIEVHLVRDEPISNQI